MSSLSVPIHIRFGDIDSYGHVNNVVQLQYLEDARVRLSEEPITGIDGVPDGTTFRKLGGGALTVVGRQEIEYTAQLLYRLEPVTVQVWVSHIGSTSYVLNYRLQDGAPDASAGTGDDGATVYAVAQSTTVQVSRETGRPEPLREDQRRFLERYRAEPVTFGRRPQGD